MKGGSDQDLDQFKKDFPKHWAPNGKNLLSHEIIEKESERKSPEIDQKFKEKWP